MVPKEVQTSGQLLTTQKGLRQEQREGQPLPSVWDVEERKVKLLAPEMQGHPSRATRAYLKMVENVSEQEALLWEKGSDYDRAVLDLFVAITRPLPGTARTLTLEQFQHVRADFRELSVEEIAEQKRQLLHEMQQLRADVHQIFPQMDS
jgi:hypothetical protein